MVRLQTQVVAALFTAALLGACAEPNPPPLAPSTLAPDVVAALQQSGATGGVAVVRIGGRNGSLTRVLAAPSAGWEAGRPVYAPGNLLQPADADPSDLFFITNPAGGQAMENAPNQVTVRFSFFCISDVITQLFDVTVDDLRQDARNNTGGHGTAHVGEKPVGRWNPNTGAPSAGIFTTTYTSEIASGDELMLLSWTAHDVGSDCEGLSTLSFAFTATRFLGLQRVTGTANLTFGAITSDHSDIFYATPNTAQRTQRAARNFFALRRAAMRLNAASLVFGGINDIANNWASPHRFHRIGTDVDIDGPADNATIFQQLILAGQAAGFRLCEVHNRNHVHCYGNARPYSTF